MPEMARDFNQSTGDKASKLTICNDFMAIDAFLKTPRNSGVANETPGLGCCTLSLKESWLNQGGTRGVTF